MKSEIKFTTLITFGLLLALTVCPAGYSATERSINSRGSAAPVLAESERTPVVQIHMQIPDIARDQAIEVFYYDHFTFREAAAAGGGAGSNKVHPGPVTIGKRIDCYSPMLHQIHLTGQHLKEVTLSWSRFDPDTKTEYFFFAIKLSDVNISAIHTRLPNQNDSNLVKLGDIEEVSFTYSKIEMACGGV